MSDWLTQLREASKRFLVASDLKRSDQPNTPYVKIMGPSVDDVEIVLAAARRFLALTETGQQEWRCETHRSRFLDKEPDKLSMCLWMLHEDNWDAIPEPDSCVPVPAFVILADYLTEDTR